jgi:hypothetical protein
VCLVLGLLAGGCASAPAAPQGAASDTMVPHVDPASGEFTFRTPVGWQVEEVAGRKGMSQAVGPDGIVRFLLLRTETGRDSLHVSCMAEQLLGGMEVSPVGSLDYDFVDRRLGDWMALESAMRLVYDRPIQGHRKWRQRTVSLVGEGRSLCIMVHCPVETWKESKPTRRRLDAIVASVRFRSLP